MFQHCTTGNQNEYSTLDETFAPEVLTLIENWISEQVKN